MTTLATTDTPLSSEPIEQRFVFGGADWPFYQSVLRRVGDRRVFVTYDRGSLEVMLPSWEHEEYARFMGKLVPIIARASGVPYRGGGSTTFRRRAKEAGLEPDQCFYLRNAPRIQGRRRVDLGNDPPPDLAIEIEVTRRLLDRQNVYARLGVPELWRYDGDKLRVFRLGKAQRYRQVKQSPSFPALPLSEIHRLLQLIWDVSEPDWEDAAVEWARRTLGQSIE